MLLRLRPNVITFRTLLHLGPNVITFRTLLHLGQLLHLGLQQGPYPLADLDRGGCDTGTKYQVILSTNSYSAKSSITS